MLSTTRLEDVLPILRRIEQAKDRLKDMGVIRSDGDTIGDFAEWYAAQELGLELMPTGVNPITMLRIFRESVPDQGAPRRFACGAHLVQFP
jgi:hypothetical protein